MTTTDDPITPPPEGLSPEATALWEGYHRDLAEEDLEPDARELAVLAEACRHLTLTGRLEAALAEVSDLIVPGSRHNDRVHPLVGELDRARKTVATLLRSIAPKPDRSTQASMAATARWRRSA